MVASDVDDYIASFPPDVRDMLQEIRRRIHAVVPDTQETISYRMPTFTVGARSLIHLAAWESHVSIYPVPAADAALEAELAPYRGARSTAKFPLAQPIPYDLVERVVALLAAQRTGVTTA